MMHDNFSSQADLYARYRPRYPAEMYDFIFQHLPQKKTAWDCATGSGQVAGYLSEYFTNVYATDISKEQMSHAPKKDSIEYKIAPAEESGLPPDSFNLITVGQAVHWFDVEGFYREVNRTARPGALLALISYDIIQVDERLNTPIKNFYDYAFGKYFGKNRQHIDARYQSLPFPFEEIAAPDFEKTYQWKLKDFGGYLNSWSAVQRIKEKEGFNPVDDFLDEIAPLWPPDEAKEVTFPVFMRLGLIG